MLSSNDLHGLQRLNSQNYIFYLLLLIHHKSNAVSHPKIFQMVVILYKEGNTLLLEQPSSISATMGKYVCSYLDIYLKNKSYEMYFSSYQIMSRFDTRTCRDGGWDNQLPACEGTDS